MNIHITARHIALTPALASYAEEKTRKSLLHFPQTIWSEVILGVEKHRHVAEMVVHAGGHTFRSIKEAGDLYAAIDLVTENIKLQLTRFKDKKQADRKVKE